RWHAGFLGDHLVLLDDETPRRLVLVEPTEQFSRDTAIGALAAILIDDVEGYKIASCCRLPGHLKSPRTAGGFGRPGTGNGQTYDWVACGRRTARHAVGRRSGGLVQLVRPALAENRVALLVDDLATLGQRKTLRVAL